jgi:NAD(P)-dependent dehydrogenase (short-subunit alcohol dehydrogenase family)
MANEFAALGIRVNAVLIGLLRSHQWEVQAARAGTDLEAFYTQLAQGASPIPLGRVGESRDFGDLAAFLLSERAQFITGSAVNLDGGLSPVV